MLIGVGSTSGTWATNLWPKLLKENSFLLKWPSTGYSFNVGVVPMLLLIYLFHTEVLTTLFLCLCLGINIVSIVLLCVGMYIHDCSCLYRTRALCLNARGKPQISFVGCHHLFIETQSHKVGYIPGAFLYLLSQ